MNTKLTFEAGGKNKLIVIIAIIAVLALSFHLIRPIIPMFFTPEACGEVIAVDSNAFEICDPIADQYSMDSGCFINCDYDPSQESINQFKTQVLEFFGYTPVTLNCNSADYMQRFRECEKENF